MVNYSRHRGEWVRSSACINIMHADKILVDLQGVAMHIALVIAAEGRPNG